jgi:hypothetical protein
MTPFNSRPLRIIELQAEACRITINRAGRPPGRKYWQIIREIRNEISMLVAERAYDFRGTMGRWLLSALGPVADLPITDPKIYEEIHRRIAAVPRKNDGRMDRAAIRVALQGLN